MYKAAHVDLAAPVALKVLVVPEHLRGGANTPLLERFRLEARTSTTATPRVRTAENRAAHAVEAPDGDFADGLAQIWARFPRDRARLIFGSLAVLGPISARPWQRDDRPPRTWVAST